MLVHRRRFRATDNEVTPTHTTSLVVGSGTDEYEELFDLQADPHEMTDVSDRSEYRKLRDNLQVELETFQTQLKVPTP